MRTRVVSLTALLILFMAYVAPAQEEVSPVDTALQVISSQRDYSAFLSQRDLSLAMLMGLASALDDPYAWVRANQPAAAPHSTAGNSAGVGLVVTKDPYGRHIARVLEASPADLAGVRDGDRLLSVSGMPTAGMTEPQVAALLSGSSGTTVRIVVETPGRGERPLELERIASPEPSVQLVFGERRLARWVSRPDGAWAWLRVRWFEDPSTMTEWNTAVRRIWDSSDVAGIILDLRSNGGGHNSCIRMLGDLLPPDVPMVEFRSLFGEEDRREVVFNSFFPRSRLIAFPLVVVVDHNTASLAEVFAAALREGRKAPIVGSPTYGKGTTQTTVNLGQGFAMNLTTAEWFTPDGRSVDGQGIQPDVRAIDVARTARRDETLVAAVRVLESR